jgi:hypothetical protein
MNNITEFLGKDEKNETLLIEVLNSPALLLIEKFGL